MYDFVLSEVWWMEAIIAAAITACATLIGAALTYNYTLKKIKENTELLPNVEKSIEKRTSEHDSLSKEHDSLSKEHSGLSKEHMSILSQGRETHSKVDAIYSMTVDEKAKAELRHKALEKSDDLIVTSVMTGVSAISEKLVRLQADNNGLNKEIDSLQEQIRELKQEIVNFKEREQTIAENYKILYKENARLIEVINKQQNIEPLRSHPDDDWGLDR